MIFSKSYSHLVSKVIDTMTLFYLYFIFIYFTAINLILLIILLNFLKYLEIDYKSWIIKWIMSKLALKDI
jgi:hypothetical protein